MSPNSANTAISPLMERYTYLNAIIRLHLDEAGEDCIRRIVFLAEYLPDYLTLNVSEPEVPPHMAISEAGMIEAETMENRGLQIIHMNRIFDHIHSEIVGLAYGHAGLDPPPAAHIVKQLA